uniref:Homeobox C6 n=1 Tax=Cyanoderma ruficeps TaxID=181631 RepID=A0A8C3QLD2_9PASS
MNSYFTNPSLSCHLGGGQDVLPNVALNSSAYDPVRHFSSYGAAVAQNRIYSSPFYSPQDNAVVFGSGRSPYEYGSNAFYQDKEVLSSCRQSSVGAHGTPNSIAQDFPSEQSRASAGQEQKSSIQIYPWMQRMNSHSGKPGSGPGGSRPFPAVPGLRRIHGIQGESGRKSLKIWVTNPSISGLQTPQNLGYRPLKIWAKTPQYLGYRPLKIWVINPSKSGLQTPQNLG